jgi:hypothetical protein
VDKETTGKEPGKTTCDMSAIPGYEYAGLAGSFSRLPQNKFLKIIAGIARVFFSVTNI